MAEKKSRKKTLVEYKPGTVFPGRMLATNIAEMRKDAHRLMQMARLESEPRRKQELAGRSFEIAQRAEIIANLNEDPKLLSSRIRDYKSMSTRAGISDEQKRIFLEVIADAERLCQVARPALLECSPHARPLTADALY